MVAGSNPVSPTRVLAGQSHNREPSGNRRTYPPGVCSATGSATAVHSPRTPLQPSTARVNHKRTRLAFRSMTTAGQASSIPTSRKVLCVVYGVIAVAALIGTWSQNLAYSDKPARFLLDFINDSKVTPSSRSLTVDLLLFGLAAIILMVIEARKHGVKFVWLYVAVGFVIAISVAFPLFLIARELRMGTSDAPRLHTTDMILLAVVAVFAAAGTIWIDAG